MSSFFDNAKSFFEDFSSKIGLDDQKEESNQNQESHEDEDHDHAGQNNRYQSFAPVRQNNDAKWYVDGCSYMWAVSVAIEEAQESIWILDWWLSPGKFNGICEDEADEWCRDLFETSTKQK